MLIVVLDSQRAVACVVAFARMQIDPSLRGNVTMAYYAGGHMMYIDRAAHRKLREDVVKFIRDSM